MQPVCFFKYKVRLPMRVRIYEDCTKLNRRETCTLHYINQCENIQTTSSQPVENI